MGRALGELELAERLLEDGFADAGGVLGGGLQAGTRWPGC